MIKVIITPDAHTLAIAASQFIAGRLLRRPNLVLGLATGGTVIDLYSELVRRYKAGEIDFNHVTTFNLDEYVGLPPYHPQSYQTFMFKHLFSHINIPRSHIHLLNGMAQDTKRECRDYETAIAATGGIDLQILGIGRNGHIAFNEPGAKRNSRTRKVRLSDDTIAANGDGRFFKNSNVVPHEALSMGIETIMEAREILLLATGSGKSLAIKRALQEPPSDDLPASFLQTHPACTFILDREASSLLNNQQVTFEIISHERIRA